MVKGRDNPGKGLRSLRLALGLTFRDVHQASVGLATKLRKREFIIPASRLHDIETKNLVPSVYRLFTLARIYQLALNEILEWYGIPRR